MSQHRPGTRARAHPVRAVLVRAGVSLAMVGAGLIGGAVTGPGPAQAATGASLLPGVGQLVSVPIVKVFDTRSAIGTTSTAKLAAGASVTVTVAGSNGVPAGADSVVANINAINVTQPGTLEVYDAESPDPSAPSVTLQPGVNNTQTDTVPLSTTGKITFTNASSAAVDVSATVVGYYTGPAATNLGDTYTGVAWSKIVDTTTGTGVALAQIAAAGTITVQVTGQGGVPAGAAVAALQLNAFDASSSGYLSAYSAGVADPKLAVLSYGTGVIYRNLNYVPLSSTGAVKITNESSVPVDLTIYTRGYFSAPSAGLAGGSYTSIDPFVVYSSTGSPLAANASATVQVTSVASDTEAQAVVPPNATQVAEEVVVANPSVKGAVATGTATANVHPAVSFLAGGATTVGFDHTVLTSSGQETVTNQSTSPLALTVRVIGFFTPPSAPDGPAAVAATVSGTSATVTWAVPDSDGGSAITGYTVTAPPDTASATVAPGTRTATLTGLTHPAADTYTVVATSAVGTGAPATYQTQAAVVSGVVHQGSGLALAGETVNLFTADPPTASATTWTPVQVGTTTTDANGGWSFTVPPYASLPADAQAAANNNGGVLNLQAIAAGTATAGGTTYAVTATAIESAFVGGAAARPVPSGAPTVQTMVLYPQGPDDSAANTAANEANTAASLNASDVTGDPAGDTTVPTTDAYGFQEIGGNGTYNPNIAADGTNLAAAAVTPATPSDNPCYPYPEQQVGASWDKWVTIGEAHAWWNATGTFSYGAGGSTTVGAVASFNAGESWQATGSFSFTDSGSFSDTIPVGDHTAHRVKLHMNMIKVKTTIHCLHGGNTSGLVMREDGLDNVPGSDGVIKFSTYNLTGEDGRTAFRIAPVGFINSIARGGRRCISQGKTTTYTGGVTLAGVGVSVTTSYDSSTQQCILAGNSKTRPHYEWGRNGPYNSKNPNVLLSY